MKKSNTGYYIFALSLLLVLTASLIRPVNIDEAYYIVSGQEILDGKLPYGEFLFHQMPLSIYLYSFISDLDIASLFLGRFVSVILLLISFALLGSILRSVTKENTFVLFGLLFFFNAFLIDWSVLIKTYSLSILLLSFGTYCIHKYSTTGKQLPSFLFFSVLSFSLLVFTKISYISNLAVLVTFVILLMMRAEKGQIYRDLIIVVVSALIPIVVFFILFGGVIEEFYFNVFRVNFITKQSIDAAFSISLMKFLAYFVLPQSVLLLVIILVPGFKFTLLEKFIIASIFCFVLTHIFSRMLMEYLCSVTPLFILLSALRYEKFKFRIAEKFPKVKVKNILVFTTLLYIAFWPLSLIHLKGLIAGDGLLMNPVQLYTFEKRLNSLNGKSILSSWEGYSIFSKKEPILRDQYGAAFINKLVNDADILKYRIAQEKDYRNLILNKIPDIIAYDELNTSHLDGMEAILNINYERSFVHKSVVVYQKRGF